MKEVLKFSADWCGPCQALSTTLKGMDDLDTVIKEIDIDDQLDLAAIYNIRSVPTLVVLQDGVEVRRKTGALNKTQIKEFING
jgi:thioredoxin 1